MNDAEAFVIDEVFFRYLFCDKVGQVSVRDEEDIFISFITGLSGNFSDLVYCLS